MECAHNDLKAKKPLFTGIVVDRKEDLDGVCGMFIYKKYICLDCGYTITILEAVVSKEA